MTLDARSTGIHGHYDRMVVGFTATCVMPITTNIVSSSPVHGSWQGVCDYNII